MKTHIIIINTTIITELKNRDSSPGPGMGAWTLIIQWDYFNEFTERDIRTIL